jgi:hypothetical protein
MKEADMRQVRLFGIPVLALSVIAFPTGLRAAGDDTKTARGTVTALSGNSVTVKVGAKDMTFNVDDKTEVIAAGAGTKARAAQSKGMAGPKLADVVKTGQAVRVSYHETGSTLHAARIEGVASAGSGGGHTSDEKAAAAAKHASGTVKTVAGDSLVVTHDGKDMTFGVDSKTKVIGTGLGTKGAPKGGKLSITEAVSAGDKVTVTYHDMGSSMHASTVRVTAAAKK